MSQSSELARLEERKRWLIAESDQYRQEIADALDNIRATTAWVQRGYSVMGMVRTYWPLVASLAGFLFVRKRLSWVRKLGKAWSLWRLGRRLFGLWRSRASHSAPVEESAFS